VLLSIVGQLGKRTDERAVPGVAGLVAPGNCMTAVCTAKGQLFTVDCTFGSGSHLGLGHGGTHPERVPKLVDALAGMQVIGVSAAGHHTAVWTDVGELLPSGMEAMGRWATEGNRGLGPGPGGK